MTLSRGVSSSQVLWRCAGRLRAHLPELGEGLRLQRHADVSTPAEGGTSWNTRPALSTSAEFPASSYDPAAAPCPVQSRPAPAWPQQGQDVRRPRELRRSSFPGHLPALVPENPGATDRPCAPRRPMNGHFQRTQWTDPSTGHLNPAAAAAPAPGGTHTLCLLRRPSTGLLHPAAAASAPAPDIPGPTTLWRQNPKPQAFACLLQCCSATVTGSTVASLVQARSLSFWGSRQPQSPGLPAQERTVAARQEATAPHSKVAGKGEAFLARSHLAATDPPATFLEGESSGAEAVWPAAVVDATSAVLNVSNSAAAEGAGELAAAAAGVWMPTAAVQHCTNTVHAATGWPWRTHTATSWQSGLFLEVSSPFCAVPVRTFTKRPKKWHGVPWREAKAEDGQQVPYKQPNEGATRGRNHKRRYEKRDIFKQVQHDKRKAQTVAARKEKSKQHFLSWRANLAKSITKKKAAVAAAASLASQ